MNKISVVVPVYNEALAIEENIRVLTVALESLKRQWELILVNDGSTDGTTEILDRASKSESRIKVISYKQNRGRGYALKTGFAASSGDYVVATESDLNWGTDIIGRFAAELDRGEADVVIASPHMRGGRMVNVPVIRRVLSSFGNMIFSLAFPGRLTMMTGMTRGYRKEVLDSLDLEANDKELHVEILSKALDLGYRVKEIPATLAWRKPAPGTPVRKSHFKARSILKHLLVSFDVQPFLLFGAFGFLLLGAGLALGVYLLIQSFSVGIAGRPALFVFMLLLLGGFQALVFGFLASQNRETKRTLVRMQKQMKEISGKR